MNNIKITVMRKFSPEEVFGHEITDPPSGMVSKVCSKVEQGQEFLIDGLVKPKGFCSWAWHDIYKDLLVLLFGGEHNWTERGVMYTSCTDGKRPVCFKLERIES